MMTDNKNSIELIKLVQDNKGVLDGFHLKEGYINNGLEELLSVLNGESNVIKYYEDIDEKEAKRLILEKNKKNSILLEKGFIDKNKKYAYEFHLLRSNHREGSIVLLINNTFIEYLNLDCVVEDYGIPTEFTEFPDGYNELNLGDLSPIDFITDGKYDEIVDLIVSDGEARVKSIESGEKSPSTISRAGHDYIARLFGGLINDEVKRYLDITTESAGEYILLVLEFNFDNVLKLNSGIDKEVLEDGLNDLLELYK